MRYYLVSIQYNKEKQAENRTVPKAYDSREEAIANFHKQMGSDMTNSTLGWAMSMVFDENGGIHVIERWTSSAMEEPQTVEVVEESEVTE